LNDDLLSDGGLVLKGASGDKQFLWLYRDGDSNLLYNAWISNTNLGISGSNDGIISRNYRSYGYGKDNSEFIFQSENTTNADLILSERNADGTDVQRSWKISKKGNSDADLVFSYAATGATTSSDLFTFTRSPSGQTFPGITISSFAYGFNSDLLDGAHGYTNSTPYSIPISNQYGKLDSAWIESPSLQKRFNINSHGLTPGNVVRITATGHIVKALAADAVQAETLGIVSGVSGDSFTVVLKGYIAGLSGPRDTVNATEFTPGDIYFLSGATPGKLLATPDTGAQKLNIGQIRKAMLLADTTVSGYVMNYVGTEIPEGTDEVYLSGLVPVGTIIPYAGSIINLSNEWVVCNGYRYTRTEYPDLHAAIGSSTYYVKASIASNTVTLEGGTRNIQVGDVLDIYNYNTDAFPVATRTVTVTNGSTLTIGGTALSSGNYKIFLKNDSGGIPIFFVPDLRTRVIVGGSTGSTFYQGNEYDINYQLGDIGGSSNIELTVDQLPPHAHGVSSTTTIAGSNTPVLSSVLGTLNSTTGVTGAGEPVDNRMPFVTLNYVIRAKRKTNATILTGHSHDLRYIRYDAPHNAVDGLTFTGRQQFRTNASVAGIALGSITSGDYHDHDGRYVRYDITPQNLTNTQKYQSRLNISSSCVAEGDGLSGLAAQQTVHNHDLIYPRFDNTAQAAFDSTSATRFRNKIGVYGIAQVDSTFLRKNGDNADGNYTFANGTVTFSDYFRCNGTIEANGNAFFNNMVRVIAKTPNIVGTPIGGEARILQSYAYPNPANFDSQCQTLVYGDFTVFGDGLPGGAYRLQPAHNQYVFSVDPLSATIEMRGGFQAANGTTVNNPKLKFIGGNNQQTPGVGTIVGLTAPADDDGAANKWYVDDAVNETIDYIDEAIDNIVELNQLKYFNRVIINPARNDAPRSTSGNVTATVGGLENGKWLVDVMVYVYPGVRELNNQDIEQRFVYTVSGDFIENTSVLNKYEFNVGVDDNYLRASSRMVVTKHICTVTDNRVIFTPIPPGNPNGGQPGQGDADLMWITNLQLTGIKIGP
jgi:microcystin-dependent protein